MSNEITQHQGNKETGIQTVLQSPAIKKRFEDMLGKRSAAFMSSIVSAVNATPALKNCDPMSVVSAAAIAAAMDLPINPSLGFSHIVPYKGAAQFQLGWKGFVQLALRTGQYKTINATEVKEGQIKAHNQFTGEMEFVSAAKSEKVVGYLLYFKLLNGYEKHFYMTRQQCEAHAKAYSASFNKGFGVWRDNFDAMALKTVVKLGLSKYGVLSVEMQQAVEFDQATVSETGEARYVDVTVEEPGEAPAGSAAEALNKKIRANAKTPEVLPREPGSDDEGAV
jgi:recombination protein RecT